MKVDLHMHTTCSDGLYTPEQLTQMAVEAGLSVMAISDHDTVAAIRGIPCSGGTGHSGY